MAPKPPSPEDQTHAQTEHPGLNTLADDPHAAPVSSDEPDKDEDDEIELDNEAEEWDEETLGLDWDESEARSVARELGITSAL